jgi:hypothetical protein
VKTTGVDKCRESEEKRRSKKRTKGAERNSEAKGHQVRGSEETDGKEGKTITVVAGGEMEWWW